MAKKNEKNEIKKIDEERKRAMDAKAAEIGKKALEVAQANCLVKGMKKEFDVLLAELDDMQQGLNLFELAKMKTSSDDELVGCPKCEGFGSDSEGTKCTKCDGTGKIKPPRRTPSLDKAG
jgi:RecJ-like exonuclease